MSKNKGCPTLAFESEPGFNQTMFPQTASPHGSNLTCSAPLSRNQVPKISSARPGPAVSRNAVKARQRRAIFIIFSRGYCCRLTDVCQTHIAQGGRKAACDEVRYRGMQLLVLGGIAGAGREILVDRSARSCDPDRPHLVQRRGGHLFNDIERLAVDYSYFVEGVDMVGGCEQRAERDETYPFDPSGTATEIRFRLGNDDIGVESLRRHFSLNELLEWIATNEVDGRNRRVLDRRKG